MGGLAWSDGYDAWRRLRRWHERGTAEGDAALDALSGHRHAAAAARPGRAVRRTGRAGAGEELGGDRHAARGQPAVGVGAVARPGRRGRAARPPIVVRGGGGRGPAGGRGGGGDRADDGRARRPVRRRAGRDGAGGGHGGGGGGGGPGGGGG